MRSRRNSAKNLNNFYIDSLKKRNSKRMRLQADQVFQQNEIKKLNEKFSVNMFFDKNWHWKRLKVITEQKIRELKKKISKLKV